MYRIVRLYKIFLLCKENTAQTHVRPHCCFFFNDVTKVPPLDKKYILRARRQKVKTLAIFKAIKLQNRLNFRFQCCIE